MNQLRPPLAAAISTAATKISLLPLHFHFSLMAQPHDNSSATATATATTTTSDFTATITNIANIPPQNPSPTPKIPFRPRKIRKLSLNNTSTSKSSPIHPSKTPKTTTKSTKTEITPPQPNPLPKIVAQSLTSEGEIQIALNHLRKTDPQLAPLIELHPPPNFDSSHPPFLSLSKSILYQQLATKAATTIYNRFVSLCGGEAAVLPATVLALTPQQLREIGVSGRKASYLHDLSDKYQSGILSDSSIIEMDDKLLFTMLTMVKGIGPWSVHMFMIFSLYRPDVLPVSDLGVRKGVRLLYGLGELPKALEMEELCEKWRPYRSVGAWYMWRLLEGNGAPSSGVTVAADAAGL